jgi:transposase
MTTDRFLAPHALDAPVPFDHHHGLICQMMLERIEELTARIEDQAAPFAAQVAQLEAVTGIGLVCAQELIAEIGVDMAVFATAGHLASWARFAPHVNTSAAKAKTAATGKGNPWLAATLGEIAVTAGRTNTFLGQRYRRIAKTPWPATRPRRGRRLHPDHRVASAG